MYKVVKCKYPQNKSLFKDGWLLEHTELYPFWANKYLHSVNTGSSNTAKQYAYKLCKFLNYLESIWKMDYRKATNQHLTKFFTYMMYGIDGNIVTISESNKSGFTMKMYFTVIKQFYIYVSKQNLNLKIDIEIETKKTSKYSYLYGQYWKEVQAKIYIDNVFERGKNPILYEKWYSDEQINAIISNLNTYRDKAIFSLSLDGLRIDEIISLEFSDYNNSQGLVELRRSKGKQEGQVDRFCILSERSISFIEEYLFNERSIIEDYFIQHHMAITNNLLINLRNRRDSYGKSMKYHNALEIIKTAAKKAGLDPKKIRTHSGRSTKAGELFRTQTLDPSSYTDNEICSIMGWANMASGEPYKNRNDKYTALENHRRLEKRKTERKNENKRL